MEDRTVLVVRATFFCQECDRPWLEARERWRLYLDPEEPRAVPYCPECSQREFGHD